MSKYNDYMALTTFLKFADIQISDFTSWRVRILRNLEKFQQSKMS